MKKLYEKYAGKKAKAYGSIGVICGYSDTTLIMAIEKNDNAPNDSSDEIHIRGWLESVDSNTTIVTNKDNKLGYWHVAATDIIKITMEESIMKALYEKYAGMEVKALDVKRNTVFKGIVCGYSNDNLIMAITEYISGKYGNGWYDTSGDKIITHTANKLGYWYVDELDLSKFN